MSPRKSEIVINPAVTGCSHATPCQCPEHPRCQHAIDGVECAACMTLIEPGVFRRTVKDVAAPKWFDPSNLGVWGRAKTRSRICHAFDGVEVGPLREGRAVGHTAVCGMGAQITTEREASGNFRRCMQCSHIVELRAKIS